MNLHDDDDNDDGNTEFNIDSLTEVIRENSLSNRLQFTLTNPPTCHIPNFPQLNLILDKQYFPESFIKRDKTRMTEAWCHVAAGAAAYAYKTIGSGLSQSVRKWLANAACSAVLFSLLGEKEKHDESHRSEEFDYHSPTYHGNFDVVAGDDDSHGDDTDDDVTHEDIDEDNDSDWNPPTVQQSDEGSTQLTRMYIPDGSWMYGKWTEDNMASAEEMKSVLQGEMMNECVRVMIASVICFFHEGHYIPHRRNDYYPMHIIQSDVMNKYGVVEEGDKLFLMYTTGRWISKLNLLTLIMKQWSNPIKLYTVRTLGLGMVYMPEIIIECFSSLPSGWIDVYLVDCIAEKLVRSRCIRYFSDYTSLISHKRLVRQLSTDLISYHTENNLLTDEKCFIEKADIPCLYGRLITFLKYSEPGSELFTYCPQLKIFGETREQYYEDYCPKWESIVRYIYSRDIDSFHGFDSDVLDGELKPLNLGHDFNENLLNVCFQVYGVHA